MKVSEKLNIDYDTVTLFSNGNDFHVVNGVVGFDAYDKLEESNVDEDDEGSVSIDVDDMSDSRCTYSVNCDHDILDAHCVADRQLYVVVQHKRTLL